MIERKYSVAEIDRMREAVGTLMHPDGCWSSDERGNIENRLRTYMLNGTDPEELERESSERMRRFEAERDAWEAERLSDGHLNSYRKEGEA